MRISITKTQAFKRESRHRLTSGLFAGVLLCAFGLAGSNTEVKSSWPSSLVRLSLKYETSGLFHEDRYFSQSKVIEVTDFQGVVIDARGYIVSYVGSHWLKMGARQSHLLVEFSDGSSEPARLVGIDERIEMAIVQSGRAAGREVPLGSSLSQKQLTLVFAQNGKWRETALCLVGVHSNPLFPEKTLLARVCDPDSHTSAERGSLVLDAKGRLLGIVTETDRVGLGENLKRYQVVPTDVLNGSLRELLDTGENLRAGYLGIYGETEGKSVVVTGVGPSTPAADAGLLAGDVVVEVESQRIQNLMELAKILRWRGPGNPLEVAVKRDEEMITVHPVLSSHPEEKPVYGWKLEVPRVWVDDSREQAQLKLSPVPLPSHLTFGLVVDPLSPQLASFFKVPNGRGLLVTSVLEESLASKSGFQAGDVLVEINGTELNSPSDMREVLQSGGNRVMVVRFVRDGTLQSRKLVFH